MSNLSFLIWMYPHWATALCYTFRMDAYYSDTEPKMEALQIQLLRAAPSWRKMEILAALNEAASALALAGLRQRHPKANEQELHRRLAELLLGEDLARKVYGDIGDSA